MESEKDAQAPEHVQAGGIVSIEHLCHFQCVQCKGWWSIGDAPKRPHWWCPWCGTPQAFRLDKE